MYRRSNDGKQNMSPREHREHNDSRSYRNQQQNYNNNNSMNEDQRNHQQNHVNDASHNTNYASLVRYVQDSWNKIMTENVEIFNPNTEPIRN